MMLVYAFIISQVKCCSVNVASSLQYITDTLHAVNAACRRTSCTRKYDHDPFQLLHNELHSLDVLELQYKHMHIT